MTGQIRWAEYGGIAVAAGALPVAGGQPRFLSSSSTPFTRLTPFAFDPGCLLADQFLEFTQLFLNDAGHFFGPAFCLKIRIVGQFSPAASLAVPFAS
jgi:hypothetical protein